MNIKQTKSASTYANYLKTFKVYYRDFLKQPEIIQDYKFPKQSFRPKVLPSKEGLRIFYNSLPLLKYKIIFLALASSGLRINELLKAELVGNMVIPKCHNGQTKQSYISFMNDETMSLLRNYQSNPFNVVYGVVDRTFKNTSKKCGVKIYPHLLRSIFAREASKAGIADRYIDCFCGRTPQSVLARHYSDYSPEVLKEIYEKAGIKILSDS